MPTPKIKAIFFDFMGTCLNWHTSVVNVLPQNISESDRSSLAQEWRHDYFASNAARVAAHQPPEDIDLTLRKTLDALLIKHPEYTAFIDGEATKRRLVRAWHSMCAWPDVRPALEQLKAQGYEVFVFANGTVRLQLDLCKSSGLTFDMLFSSELLGVYKPSPESYRRVLELVGGKAEEAVMVAAHAYDTRGAREAGMKTMYVRRWTDDVGEDMRVVRRENDVFLEGMGGLAEVVGGL
ncbi:MAG: hypothetical protein Q9227_002495 [Pyrenula ochraceoflavens]